MPLETVRLTVDINTHTDSLPLNGLKLANYIAWAVEKYREDEHDPREIVEVESVKVDDSPREWFDLRAWHEWLKEMRIIGG